MNVASTVGVNQAEIDAHHVSEMFFVLGPQSQTPGGTGDRKLRHVTVGRQHAVN